MSAISFHLPAIHISLYLPIQQEAEDFQTRKTLVGNVITTHGPVLVQGIIDACVFYLPSYMMADHAEVLFDLMQVDRQVRL